MSSPAIDPLPAAGDDVSGGLSVASGVSRWLNAASRRYQHLLDRSTPHAFARWICFSLVALAYIVRVYVIEGFYVVSYGLGIYILNLLIGFLSPQVDPELQDADDGPTLPTKGSDEFRPFVRRLPEFKFWYSLARAFCIAFVMTFFPMFDVPVFWPILLMYWLVLFVVTMKRQINHMIKYKYVPFSIGKQRYTGKKPVPDEDASLLKN
ncbi:protein RER1A-like isoform X1 [Nymphaea colorata]|nr:protein RER1A-like isoform X1 [Nymphaea colorata]